MRESKIEKYLVREVLRLGGKSYKWTGEAGVPDRLLFLPRGRLGIVELKTANGIVSKLQTHQHGILRDLGFEVFVPRGMEDVDECIERILNGGS